MGSNFILRSEMFKDSKPPTWCEECTAKGYPGKSKDNVLGDGEPWGRGTIPAVLRNTPSPNGPMWPSKLGSSQRPGASDYCGPTDLSNGPEFWLEDIVGDRQGGCIGGVLVDSRGRVLLAMRGAVLAFGMEGRMHFEIRMDLLASIPALVGELLYVVLNDGSCCCWDLKPKLPVQRWQKYFCAHCPGDPSALVANKDIVVSSGREEKPVEGMVNFGTHVYGIDPASGQVRWVVKMPMPSLMIVPSLVKGAVVYMASTGAVDCLETKDGKARWQVPGSFASMSTGGASVAGQRVFAAFNRKSKKQPGAPFGGKGAVRSYDLKDGKQLWEQLFDLEANAIPVWCPAGPGGKPALIVALGASPGAPADGKRAALGEHWDGRVVALDPQSGAALWAFELLRWPHASCAGNGPLTQGKMPSPPAGWNTPAVGADGVVYLAWNVNGTLYALDGASGEEVSKFQFRHPFVCSPVVLPGALYVQMMVKGCGFFRRENPAPRTILRSLEMPFIGGSGTEHFWPCKHNSPFQVGLSEFKAPRDLSNPAWVFKTPLKLVDCWYGNSPIMDAQRNVYIGGNWSDLFIVRPDGTLRGSLYVGPYYSTPALYEDSLFVVDSMGRAACYDLDTLEKRWSNKFCDWTSSDNYSILAHDGKLFVPGNVEIPQLPGRWLFDSGHRMVYCLDCKTGETIWKTPLPLWDPFPAVLWNFTPVIFEDRLLTMDNFLGVYCMRWRTGELVWYDRPVVSPKDSTGNMTTAPNGLVYVTGNFEEAEMHFNYNGDGRVRAYDVLTGQFRFECLCRDERGHLLACNQGPVVVPARDGGRDILAVPFSTNIGGNPADVLLGNLFSGKLAGFDASTGDEVWSTEWPPWRHTHVGGSFIEDPGLTWPDSWGGLSTGSDGTLYAHWMDGMIYAVEGMTGQILSKYNTFNSSNAQILLGPGMAVFTGGFGCFCFRDPELEKEWQAEAKARGDPRAALPLLDIPVPREDDPPREEWEKWRGPIYAEEQNFREGSAWIEEWSKMQAKAQVLDREWSTSREKPGGKVKWVVVGGGENGIIVRKGEGLKSEELPRLSKGARVEQVGLKGDRLHFRKLEGSGPDSGWISLTFKGVPLVEPA